MVTTNGKTNSSCCREKTRSGYQKLFRRIECGAERCPRRPRTAARYERRQSGY